MNSGAVVSRDGRYRWMLWRVWSNRPNAVFVMLNPSTADATHDDPTIRRCVGFAKAWGLGGIAVGNLYAFRATDPAELARAGDPVGPYCEIWLEHMLDVFHRGPVVCAWGARPEAEARAGRVLELLARCGVVAPQCLGTTKAGHPRHPLYLAKDTQLVPYRP